MRIFNKRITKSITTAFVLVGLVGVVGLGMSSMVDARTAYDPNGMPTSATPIFNDFYDVPQGVGDEADFVRVRANGGTNADYISTLNGACNVGDKYDVRTYVHNGADPNYNNGGSGTAVAHDVVVAMQAELAKADSEFDFKSTISASNAASVSDTGLLKCGTKTVKLNLVPNSVQTYSKPLGFQGVSDSAVNGTLKIGSRVQGSGDVWGCWDDRVIVTYTVVVETVPVVPPQPPELTYALDCKLDLNQNGPNVAVAIQPIATNVTPKSYSINFGDETPVVNERTASHTYVKYGDFKIVGTVKGVNDKGKEFTANCEKPVNVPKPDMKLVCTMLIKTNMNSVGAAIDASKSVNIVPSSVKYSINFNDGTIVDAQTATHTYKDYGKHVVTGTVTGTGIDGTKFTANCEESFTSEKPVTPPVTPPVPPQPPVVPPVQPPVTPQPPVVPPVTPVTPVTPTTPTTPTMPETGAASMVGLVSAVSVLGAIGHRAWIVRRVQ